MKNEDNRRKFLQKGVLGALTLGLAAPEVLADDKVKIKCLSKDGKLVEIEVSKSVMERGRNVNTNELKNWINPDQINANRHE